MAALNEMLEIACPDVVGAQKECCKGGMALQERQHFQKHGIRRLLPAHAVVNCQCNQTGCAWVHSGGVAKDGISVVREEGLQHG
eukprot:CAMPEP_0117469130 /NCGR_PEP_ID=MMETSP0784-20121206/6532_1 /TAXON_ID=39447 /ORGANISM="" /LENGTH=83 /DNA_ID=CAMNT_0005263159 /DNA_START=366 /DNA_END=617 /DNA_ORIENTATION=+